MINLREYLQKETELNLVIVESYDHGKDKLFILVISPSGVKHVESLDIGLNFEYVLLEAARRLVDSIIVGEGYVKSQQTLLKAQNKMAELNARQKVGIKAAQALFKDV